MDVPSTLRSVSVEAIVEMSEILTFDDIDGQISQFVRHGLAVVINSTWFNFLSWNRYSRMSAMDLIWGTLKST